MSFSGTSSTPAPEPAKPTNPEPVHNTPRPDPEKDSVPSPGDGQSEHPRQ